MKVKAWDCETTTRAYKGRTASPFGGDNWVVMQGWTTPTMGHGYEVRFYGKTPPADGWFEEVLADCDLLVGFNIAFDLLWAIAPGYDRNRAAWRRWVANGGRVWDCQVAEYILNGAGPAHQYLSLDETAPRYGGGVKIDEVKLLWEQGISTEFIDPVLLQRYLCGRDGTEGWEPGDLHNTLLIYKAQVQRAQTDGVHRKFMACDMAALVALVEMERNGDMVDAVAGEARRVELVALAAQQQEKLKQYVAHYPGEFSWRSRFHKSALFFGGRLSFPRTEYRKGESYVFEPPVGKDPSYSYAQEDAIEYTFG